MLLTEFAILYFGSTTSVLLLSCKSFRDIPFKEQGHKAIYKPDF